MPALQEGNNLGDLLKYEAPNLYSREVVTVAGGELLLLGVVLGMVATSGKVKTLNPAATDGTQIACGISICEVDATLMDRDDGLMIARHAAVADFALVWPDEITAAEKRVAIQQLKNLGILVREGR